MSWIAKLDNKIDAQGAKFEEKMNSFHNEMQSEFRRLNEKIDLALEFREPLEKLDAKLSVCESRN
ncbi:MAG: hypothetical protein IH978_02095 [Nitrospinae bacterium]|nr:hypothetical protein [Nitrospinota bacterium]